MSDEIIPPRIDTSLFEHVIGDGKLYFGVDSFMERVKKYADEYDAAAAQLVGRAVADPSLAPGLLASASLYAQSANDMLMIRKLVSMFKDQVLFDDVLGEDQ